MTDISDREFNQLKEQLNKICGIDVPPEKRYLFKTRLGTLCQEENCRTFAELCGKLSIGRDKALQRRVVQAMTTHESSFFRDRHPFDALKNRILPEIGERRLQETSATKPRLRLLSCGCSAGQEPYSMAICVQEWLATQTHFRREDITIFGADISRTIIGKAGAGLYTNTEIGRFMPHDYRMRYLKKHGEHWEVSASLREMVRFAELNLADSFSYIGKFDVIFCRNVIIYFSAELKKKIVDQFQRMLNPGGTLVLGASESLYPLSQNFTSVNAGLSTYYQVN